MAEHNLNDRILHALRRLHPIRVENPSLPGTPDINFVEGWIESKQVVALPKRQDTPLRIKHYTKEQRVFGMQRVHQGGNHWVCLEVRVGHIVMLIRGDVAAQHLGKVCFEDLVTKHASLVLAPWDDDAFLDFIEKHNPRRRVCLPESFEPLIVSSSGRALPTQSLAAPARDRTSHGPF